MERVGDRRLAKPVQDAAQTLGVADVVYRAFRSDQPLWIELRRQFHDQRRHVIEMPRRLGEPDQIHDRRFGR